MASETNSTGGLRIEPKDLRCQERQDLEKILPLDTPFVVYIEPTNVCNFRCQFCPTGDPDLLRRVGRPIATMKLDLFKKIVDDLKAFPQKLKLLSLYKDGEPLVHKLFPDMVRYARDAGVAERIWTKTNGSLLNPELNARIADAGLDLISISVEGVSREAYKRIADVDIDYDAFRRNLEDLYRQRGRMDVLREDRRLGTDFGGDREVLRRFRPHEHAHRRREADGLVLLGPEGLHARDAS